jgi:hypothetical protein
MGWVCGCVRSLRTQQRALVKCQIILVQPLWGLVENSFGSIYMNVSNDVRLFWSVSNSLHGRFPDCVCISFFERVCSRQRKGSGSTFPHRTRGSRRRRDLEEANRHPGESFLLFLTGADGSRIAPGGEGPGSRRRRKSVPTFGTSSA